MFTLSLSLFNVNIFYIVQCNYQGLDSYGVFTLAEAKAATDSYTYGIGVNENARNCVQWTQIETDAYFHLFCTYILSVSVLVSGSVNLPIWCIHTGCLRDWDKDWNWDMDEWVVCLYVEPFTLHLNSTHFSGSETVSGGVFLMIF